MGTYYRVTVADPIEDEESLRKGIEATLDRIDRLMSTYREDSELSRLNRLEGGEWFTLSEEVGNVLDIAIDVHQLSGGALDVTAGPLVNLWHFGPEPSDEDTVPTDVEIAQAKALVGLDQIDILTEPLGIRKRSADVSIDLSSIAKGYAVDCVSNFLKAEGYKNYLVDIGGELKGTGQKSADKPWRVAVEAPKIDRREIHRVVSLRGQAMATSGDYRNYFEKDGVRYCHIIDPRTGRPVAHRLASVSIIDPNCTRADAWATALFVLGEKEGFDLATRQGLTALFIIKTEDGFTERATPAFEKRLMQTPK